MSEMNTPLVKFAWCDECATVMPVGGWAEGKARVRAVLGQAEQNRGESYKADARENACSECASLRQQLEEAQKERDEAVAQRERLLGKSLQHPSPEGETLIAYIQGLQARAEQADAALAEMQKLITQFNRYLDERKVDAEHVPSGEAFTALDDAQDELERLGLWTFQRRRSPTGQP